MKLSSIEEMRRVEITGDHFSHKTVRTGWHDPISVSAYGVNSGVTVTMKTEDDKIISVRLPKEVIRIIKEDIPKHFENPAYAWGCFKVKK